MKDDFSFYVSLVIGMVFAVAVISGYNGVKTEQTRIYGNCLEVHKKMTYEAAQNFCKELTK